MRRPALLLPSIALLALAFAGCDPAVHARYQPTTVDEIYGPFAYTGGVEPEVLELPATPPASEGEVTRRACRPPGQVMKPVDLVALQHDDRRLVTREPVALYGWKEEPLPSPPPGPAYRIASWNLHDEPGVKEPIATPIEPSTLQPGTSIYRNEPALYGAYRSDERIYCNDPATLR